MKDENIQIGKQTEKPTTIILEVKKKFQDPIVSTYKPLEIMSAWHGQASALVF